MRLIAVMALGLTLSSLVACSNTRQVDGEKPVDHSVNREILPDEPILNRIRRIPGVEISGGELRIRGNRVPPLIVVDGIPINGSSLDFLNPNDVDSIEVLPVNQAARYGTDASGGVILITTKRENDNQ